MTKHLRKASVKIGIDLHNLSTKPDSVVRTGIQQVVFNLLEAQNGLRKKMMEKHVQKGVIGTIGLMSRDSPSKYGNVIVDGDMITKFEEKPRKAVSHIVNAGIYIFTASAFDLMSKCSSLEKDLFPKLAEMNQLTGFFTMGEYHHAEN